VLTPGSLECATMKRLLPAAIGLVVLVAACASAPYTHRSQLILVSQSQETALGADAYKQVLSKAKIDRDPKINAIVHEVGERIARAADRPDYKWEFTVIDAPDTVNAFALPGGKVAVYTGLLPVAHDTAGLAAVLGHEVGHAIAHHGAERMSQAMGAQALGVALSVGLGGSNPQTANAIMQLYGLGAQVGVLLPWSRTQESEADHIGLILMAKAGYNPEAALELWQRMEKLEGKGSQPAEFLSTHPGYGTRQHDIKAWLPEAERYFHPDPDVKVTVLPLPTSK
jgi:metalloendopeptidase OMA1, mitochondrial